MQKFDNTQALQKAVERLTKARVLAGVPAAKSAREPEEGEIEPLNNAELAYLHDHGDPANGLPQREFMRPGIMLGKPGIVAGMKAAGQAALAGDLTGVDKGLNRAGLAAQTGIQTKILEGPFAPLKPSTIRAKGSDVPLIDTSQMLKSISYVIEKPQV